MSNSAVLDAPTEPARVVPMTLGEVASRNGCQLWQVRRLFERGLVPEPPRLGQTRLIYADQLPAVEKALIDAGYVTPRQNAGAVSA